MKNYALELFLLTTTLSQMNNREMVIRLFVESMNDIFPDYSYKWENEKKGSETSIEVCTRKKSYGYFTCLSSGDIEATEEKLIHNAVQLLAIFLEKIEQETNLQHLVNDQTEELSAANENLAISNTELKEQIQAHKQTLETLRKSEEKYKSLIDKVQTAIVLYDAYGNIINTNPLADSLLGISEEDTAAEASRKLQWDFYREDGTKMQESEYPVYQVLTRKIEVRDFIIGIGHREPEKLVWALLNAEPEFDENGEIIQVIVSFIDMTERRKTDEMLRQSQKMDAIGQLAGGVAHDLNNMLGGIVAAAQILKNPKQNLDEKGLKFADLILDASQQAAELTTKLLAFGRKTEIEMAPVSICSIIDDTISLLRRTVDKRISISFENQADEEIVSGNKTALQNALLNMGINASHAMPKGGKLQIKTRNICLNEKYGKSSPFEIAAGNYIEIEIGDTGTGISPENISKVFEPFFTTKKQGQGTGLGLSTVYATVQNHLGAINIHSELGTGTVFHIYLPTTEKNPEAYPGKDLSFSGKGVILLVDDEELIRVTAQETLEEMGFSVITAENGREAVNTFKERNEEIDLVIMDMLMPVMNGSDAFMVMKDINRDCPVIISSGFTKDENLKELKDAGLAGFIQKPFRIYDLSQLISEVLNHDHP
ncbi:MAG: response regulator [Spirochaetales bacterium]|nr:response regulator [Spirochaetales bacterium]